LRQNGENFSASGLSYPAIGKLDLDKMNFIRRLMGILKEWRRVEKDFPKLF